MPHNSELPTIDIRALDNGDAVAIEDLGSAASDIGFFLLEGMDRDIPAGLAESTFQEAAKLFAERAEVLAEITLDRASDSSNRGFEGLGSQSLNPNTRAGRGDLNFSFRCTEDRDPRLDDLIPSPVPAWSGFFNKPNKWPNRAALPCFRDVQLAYLRGAGNVAEIIFRGLERAFEMEPGYLVNKHGRRLFTLRNIFYPKISGPTEEGRVGCGLHTDFGTITLLQRRGDGCLTIRRRNGEWMDIQPPPETMIVNIGDMLEWWTDGQLVSTPHCVNRGQGDYSIVLFCYADFWEKLRDGVTAGEYLNQKLTQSYRHVAPAA